MAVRQKLTDGEVKALAELLLAPEMADLGFTGVDVEHRDIYGDGSSLYIGARVSGDVPAPFDPERRHRFFLILNDALLDRGDERFPHLVLKRQGDGSSEPDHLPADP